MSQALRPAEVSALVSEARPRVKQKAHKDGVNAVYSEILYSPLGETAVMSGATGVVNARFALPGGGTLFTTGSGGNNRYYEHKDWLGTARVGSTILGATVDYDRAFAPYGEIYSNFGSADKVNFTGDMQDLFSGLSDTPNRELNNIQGRWISPDPAGSGWNAYAYGTDPNGGIDPTGLEMCCWGGSKGGQVAFGMFAIGTGTAGADAGSTVPANSEKESRNPGADQSTPGQTTEEVQNTNSGGFWQKLGNALSGNGWKTNDQVIADQRQWLSDNGTQRLDANGTTSVDWSKASSQDVASAYKYIHQVMSAAKTDHLLSMVGIPSAVIYGHGARHLKGTGLNQSDVESAIKQDVETAIKNATQPTGNFWGRIDVSGQTVEYRAYTLPNGTVNVGTYYIP